MSLMKPARVTLKHLREQECQHAPVTLQKHRIAAHECHNETPCQSIPRGIRLAEALVRQRFAIKALRIARPVEADERGAHDAEIDELRRRDEVHEPLQHNGRVFRDLQGREQSQAQHDQHTVDRDALPRAAGQEARRLALERGPEQRARRAVDVAVPGREGQREHRGVDDVRQHVDPESVHGDDIWRGGSQSGRVEDCRRAL